MLHINLDNPYQAYIEGLVQQGVYSSADAVLKDALRQHRDARRESQPATALQVAIQEGEDDIKAGRVIDYTPGLFEKWTAEVLADV